MKLNLKRISSSFILAMTLVAPQLTHASGEEDFSDNNALVVASSSTTTDVVRKIGDEVAGPLLSQLSNESSLFESLPKELRALVLEKVAFGMLQEGKKFSELALVNKLWASDLQDVITDKFGPWSPNWRSHLGITDANENVFRQFYNGVLEYRESQEDIEPTVTVALADLMNLFGNRTFDLSKQGYQYEDVDKKISLVEYDLFTQNKNVRITTCVREFLEVGGENEGKDICLISLYEIINNCDKKFLAFNLSRWKSESGSVGLVWRWGNCRDWEIDYYFGQSVSGLHNNNFYQLWNISQKYMTGHDFSFDTTMYLRWNKFTLLLPDNKY